MAHSDSEKNLPAYGQVSSSGTCCSAWVYFGKTAFKNGYGNGLYKTTYNLNDA
jgi:hypothetical protein